MAQGRFTLAYVSHDHHHGSHTGLPMVGRVKTGNILKVYKHADQNKRAGRKNFFSEQAKMSEQGGKKI